MKLENKQFADLQRQALIDLGLSEEEVERAMQPLLSFYMGIEEENNMQTYLTKKEAKTIVYQKAIDVLKQYLESGDYSEHTEGPPEEKIMETALKTLINKLEREK
jgi:hypothetical protein